jgi:hypothetical protein
VSSDLLAPHHRLDQARVNRVRRLTPVERSILLIIRKTFYP